MKLILDFDGRLLNPSNMLEALSKAGKNTSISISNAQALNIDTLLKATTAAENTKNLSTTFNGAELTANCSGLLIPDTDLGENPRRERGV
ncbi:hypothetical protein [Pseudomonas aeruginosa]|uniref:hypothetical protein n=1 Tax=Pseudomonas aeruginosa TaxID=287 RepID=UPI0035A153C1